MKIKKILIICFVLAFFQSCAPSQTNEAIKIGVSIPNDRESRYIEFINDLKVRADNYGYTCVFEFHENKIDEQKMAITSMVEQNCDYIFLYDYMYYGLEDTLSSIETLKVISINTEINTDNDDVFFEFIPDYEKYGALIAQEIFKRSNGEDVKVLEMQQMLRLSSTRDLAKGFRKGSLEYENILLEDVCQNITDRNSAYKKILELYHQDKSIIESTDIVFAHNDLVGLGVYDALKEIGIDDVEIISIGGNDKVIKAIYAGEYDLALVSETNYSEEIIEFLAADIVGKDYQTNAGSAIFCNPINSKSFLEGENDG